MIAATLSLKAVGRRRLAAPAAAIAITDSPLLCRAAAVIRMYAA